MKRKLKIYRRRIGTKPLIISALHFGTWQSPKQSKQWNGYCLPKMPQAQRAVLNSFKLLRY